MACSVPTSPCACNREVGVQGTLFLDLRVLRGAKPSGNPWRQDVKKHTPTSFVNFIHNVQFV